MPLLHYTTRFSTEKQSNFIKYSNIQKSPLARRDNNLKTEGDLLTKTEYAEKFIEYLLKKREQLIKKPTSLKLKGEMENKTETAQQYVAFDFQQRPPLCKKSTNLHLEGDLNITTENTEKYVPLQIQKRPPLAKTSTNLHLEGEMELHPEYRDVYIEYKADRVHPTLPVHHLNVNGCLNIQNESKIKFGGYHPPIPFLREMESSKKNVHEDDKSTKYPEYKDKYREYPKIEHSPIRIPESHLRQRGEMQSLTESKVQFVEKHSPRSERRRMQNNLKLEGKIDMTPEYRKAFINFYQDGRKSPVKRRSILTRNSNLKNEGEMEINPEYRSSYVDFPRERPHLRKPEGQLQSEGEMEHITEKSAKYIQHSNYSKTETLRRDPQLKLEGNFECQPEYRKAYVDYLIRERVDRKPRPLDNLELQPKRAFEIVKSNDVLDDKNDVSKCENVLTKLTTDILIEATSTSPISNATKTHTPIVYLESSTNDSKQSSSSSSSAYQKQKKKPISGKVLKKQTASKASDAVFGEKLTVNDSFSSQQSSRNASPVPQSRTHKRSKSDESKHISRRGGKLNTEETAHNRVGSRFDNPTKVEDLAYKPFTSPFSFLVPRQDKSRKSRKDTHKEKSKAFLILDHEINDNAIDDKKCNTSNLLYKEQKWMSPWYNPPS